MPHSQPDTLLLDYISLPPCKALQLIRISILPLSTPWHKKTQQDLLGHHAECLQQPPQDMRPA